MIPTSYIPVLANGIDEKLYVSSPHWAKDSACGQPLDAPDSTYYLDQHGPLGSLAKVHWIDAQGRLCLRASRACPELKAKTGLPIVGPSLRSKFGVKEDVYLEIDVQMAPGVDVCSSVWTYHLLQNLHREQDVFEYVPSYYTCSAGQFSNGFHVDHDLPTQKDFQRFAGMTGTNFGTSFNRIGWWWRDGKVTWYVNGVQKGVTIVLPAEFADAVLGFILDVKIGGIWGMPLTDHSASEAVMRVRSLKIWAARADRFVAG